MAVVTVKVYTTLKDKLGFSQIEIKADTLKDAVIFLCNKNPLIKDIILDKKNRVKNYFVITVNSDVVDNFKISKIKLNDGDIINIFPPVAGG